MLLRSSPTCSAQGNARCTGFGQRCSRPLRVVSVRSGNLEIPDSFKQALQGALSRNADAWDSNSGGGDSSYSGGYRQSGNDDYTAATARAASARAASNRAASEATPLLQVLATALGQSRATLERLQAEEAEIENLIQKERKQVERLEWLLEKVQMDYAYFNQLQKRFEDEGTNGGGGGGGGRW